LPGASVYMSAARHCVCAGPYEGLVSRGVACYIGAAPSVGAYRAVEAKPGWARCPGLLGQASGMSALARRSVSLEMTTMRS
jgi:hypothetical protein